MPQSADQQKVQGLLTRVNKLGNEFKSFVTRLDLIEARINGLEELLDQTKSMFDERLSEIYSALEVAEDMFNKVLDQSEGEDEDQEYSDDEEDTEEEGEEEEDFGDLTLDETDDETDDNETEQEG